MTGMFAVRPRRIGIALVAVIGCLMLFVFAATVARAEMMVATWYGSEFAGKTTSNGETFDPSGYTAAHKQLPFGTKLIVTYEGRSAVVKVNDRGPFIRGRELDLSEGAAEYLGLIAVGVGTVDVEVADAGTPTGPYGGTREVTRPAPDTQSSQRADESVGEPVDEPVQSTEQKPVNSEQANKQAGAGKQEEIQQDFVGTGEDQYASTDQYKDEVVVEKAVPPAPPAPKPAVPVLPPEPEPAELEAPPVELAVPNSTVERRIVLEVAAPPASTPEPAPKPAPEPKPEPVVEEEPEPVVEPTKKEKAKPVEEEKSEPVKKEKAESVEEDKAEPVKKERTEPVEEEKSEPVEEEKSDTVKEKEPEKYEAPGGITVLPDTGGSPAGVLVSGTLLLAAGLAVRVLRR